jgi:cytochrome c oxidase subunit 1
VWKSYKSGEVVEVDDPWGHGASLEWATSCPPPLRNFDRMPRIRSERPAFDLKFPELAAGASPLAPPEGGAKPLSRGARGGASYEEDTSGER